MADRQRYRVESGVQEDLYGLLDGLARAADHSLVVAVDVGDHDVTVDGLDDAFDLLHRREYGSHFAVVRHRYASHLAATGANSEQGVVERQRAGCDQGAVLA